MIPSHLAALAASLSEAQRRMLYRIAEREDGCPNSSLNWCTLSALRRRGLTKGLPCPVHRYRERLTPLGLALRNHILQEQDDA